MIDIIIPTFNNSDFTVNCFRSINNNAPGNNIIWIDNGSSVDEINVVEKETLKWQNTNFVIEKNRENLGFVKAINQGLRISKTEYVVVQNNDTLIYHNIYEKMKAVCSLGYEMVGVLSNDGWQIWRSFLKVRNEIVERKIYKNDEKISEYLFNLEPGIYECGRMQNLTFFCCMFTRELVKKVGLLDEDFSPGLGDDDDYCIRSRRAGFKMAICMNAYCYHHRRATFDLVYGDKWNEIQRNNIGMLNKKWGEESPYLKVEI